MSVSFSGPQVLHSGLTDDQIRAFPYSQREQVALKLMQEVDQSTSLDEGPRVRFVVRLLQNWHASEYLGEIFFLIGKTLAEGKKIKRNHWRAGEYLRISYDICGCHKARILYFALMIQHKTTFENQKKYIHDQLITYIDRVPEARIGLALLYIGGHYGVRNIAIGEMYLKLAADVGHPKAKYEYAIRFCAQPIKNKNYYRYMFEAALSGCQKAFEDLRFEAILYDKQAILCIAAYYYRKENATADDHNQAREWLEIGAGLGCKYAQEKLDTLVFRRRRHSLSLQGE